MNVHIRAAANGLIDLDAACARAAGYAAPIQESSNLPLCDASGRSLMEPVTADLPMPMFDHAAMDGFALALPDHVLSAGTALAQSGRVAAGDPPCTLQPGAAVRIFTGAPLPVGANAVAMQEHVSFDGRTIVLLRDVNAGDNIRRRGEDIAEGDALLSAGERLDARHIALLAAQGRFAVAVQRKIRVGVISTGNELRQPGTKLDPATIYDSNRPMVMALAAQAGLEVIDGGWVRDEAASLARVLEALSEHCDLLVTTGGAASGDEDHAAKGARMAGASLETLSIAMKPGKPAVVGRLGHAAYLGLPGNPVAALVAWLALGGAVIAALQGRPFRRRPGCPLAAVSRFERRPGRTEFAPARLVGSGVGGVEIIGRGGSARLRPLAEADGLVEIAPAHAPVEAGEPVVFRPFRDGFVV